MVKLAKGGAKGEPGKYLERHSRGRGQITKATRTLWRVALAYTTAMPLVHSSNICGKTTDGLESVDNCRQPGTSTVYGRVQLGVEEHVQSSNFSLPVPDSTAVGLNSELVQLDLILGWLGPLCGGEFVPQFRLDLLIGKAWRHRPTLFPQCRDAPRRVRQQTP